MKFLVCFIQDIVVVNEVYKSCFSLLIWVAIRFGQRCMCLCCNWVAAWFPLILGPYEVPFDYQMFFLPVFHTSFSTSSLSRLPRAAQYLSPPTRALGIYTGLWRVRPGELLPIQLSWCGHGVGLCTVNSIFQFHRHLLKALIINFDCPLLPSL